MTVYTTLGDALADPPSRTVGTLLSPADPFALKWSCQVLDPYEPGGLVWDVGHWDVDDWQGVGEWVELTGIVRGVQYQGGADQPGGDPVTGTSTLTVENYDGAVSPWATTGPFAPLGRTYLRVGALIRFGCTSNEVVYYCHFAGRIETMPESSESGADGWVDITLVDVGADLAAIDNPAAEVPVGAGDGPTARFATLTSDAEFAFPVDTTTYAPAIAAATTFQATDLGGNRLTEARLTAASCASRLVAAGGTLILAAPLSILSESDVWTLSNNPGVGDLPIPIDGVTPFADNQRILNVVTGGITGGLTVTVEDSESRGQYGPVSSNFGFPRTDFICNEEATLTAIVAGALGAHAWDEVGIATVALDADMSPLLWYAMNLMSGVTGLVLRPRLRIHWTHPSGQVLNLSVLFDGFNFGMVMAGDQAKWTGTISTSTANPGPS